MGYSQASNAPSVHNDFLMKLSYVNISRITLWIRTSSVNCAKRRLNIWTRHRHMPLNHVLILNKKKLSLKSKNLTMNTDAMHVLLPSAVTNLLKNTWRTSMKSKIVQNVKFPSRPKKISINTLTTAAKLLSQLCARSVTVS